MMVALGASGDAYTVAVNPIRDTIFGGNQTLYSIAEAATIMGAGAVTAYNNPGLLPQEGIKPPKPAVPNKPDIVEDIILQGEYSVEYAQKLKNLYKIFKSNGYDASEHALNRILPSSRQKISNKAFSLFVKRISAAS